MLKKFTSEAGLLNKCSCFVPALGVTKLISVRYEFGHTLLCYLCDTFMLNKLTLKAGLLNKSSCLSRNFKCDEIYMSKRKHFGHTLLCK